MAYVGYYRIRYAKVLVCCHALFKHTYTRIVRNVFLFGDIMDCMSNVIDIATCHTRHTNTPIFGTINMMLLRNLIHLLRSHATIRKHSNLFGNMFPTSRRPTLLQGRSKANPHIVNSIGHSLALINKVLRHGSIAQYRGNNTRTMTRRIRIHGPCRNLQLVLHIGRLGRITAHHRERTDPLSVEAKVLGKALHQRTLMSILHEQS
mmetsp:Transcript_40322/g.59263  ORF Transcript_40322/g.59263 Transcript_40322/m.59263 type:complete len:205 (-) Transcript_40322:836-1450(-)